MELCYKPRSAYGFASSTSSSFSATSSQFLTRSSSSIRHPVHAESTSTPSRSMTIKKPFADDAKNQSNGTKKACLCSPATHPGAFRCAMHRNAQRGGASQSKLSSKTTSSYHSNIRLNYRRAAMYNSLVRIGGAAGEVVKRALTVPNRPSAQNQRRRVDFKPKPSRLSVMSKAAPVQDFIMV